MISLVVSTLVLATASPCTGAQLHEKDGMLQGATGTMLGSVFVTNVSHHRCSLGGRPRVELVSLGGRIFVTQERLFALGNTGGRAITTLVPHHGAVLHLHWSNWCGSWSGRLGSFRKLFLRVVLTNGSQLTFSVVTGRARCDDEKAPSLLYLSVFTSA